MVTLPLEPAASEPPCAATATDACANAVRLCRNGSAVNQNHTGTLIRTAANTGAATSGVHGTAGNGDRLYTALGIGAADTGAAAGGCFARIGGNVSAGDSDIGVVAAAADACAPP